MRPWMGNALLLLGSVAVTAGFLEAAMAVALAYPQLLPAGDGLLGKPRVLVRNYYKSRNRWVVQYLPQCVRYDPELAYTLRPGGTCRVVNHDHVAEYSANRAGLRDTDAALESPYAVVLGDSHTMGSGVAAAESFPKQLEQDLGLPVLNAGISSFGTARQLGLLQRLELPSTRALVIQYCDNDLRENRRYVEDGALEIMSRHEHRALVRQHRRTTRYYPLKHVRNMVGSAGRVIGGERARAAPGTTMDTEEARYFLQVLERHGELIEGKTVVVLELNGSGGDDGRFVAALRDLLAEPGYAELARWISVIDVSAHLEPADYLPLDGHMKPRGHAKVARLVAEELRRRGL